MGINDLRDESADIRVHPVALFEKDAAIFWDGRRLAEQVLKNRRAGPRRMEPLRYLRKLKRIAEENQIPRCGPHRESIRERDLSGFVDDEVIDATIELMAREEPSRAGEKLSPLRFLDEMGKLLFAGDKVA